MTRNRNNFTEWKFFIIICFYQFSDEPPTKSFRCRVISGGVAIGLLVFGCVPIGIHIFCYFGDNTFHLRFFGHMSYRPSLVLAPLIIFIAAFKAPVVPYTSWKNVFVLSTSSLTKKREAFQIKTHWSICSTVLIYILVPFSVLVFKFIFNLTASKQCQVSFLIVWLATELVGVVIFSLFLLVSLSTTPCCSECKQGSREIVW